MWSAWKYISPPFALIAGGFLVLVYAFMLTLGNNRIIEKIKKEDEPKWH